MGLRNWLNKKSLKKIKDLNEKLEQVIKENEELKTIIENRQPHSDNSYYQSNNIILHDSTEIQKNVYLGSNITIGQKTYIVEGSVIGSNVSIGNYCSIANSVYIGLDEHPTNWLSTHPFQYSTFHIKNNPFSDKYQKTSPINIGHDVWIGARAIILNGVTIGNGAIIGANSVVTKNIPPYAIVAGSPAKIIRYRFDEKTIDKLQKTRWWDLPIEIIKDIDFDCIDKAITQLQQIRINI